MIIPSGAESATTSPASEEKASWEVTETEESHFNRGLPQATPQRCDSSTFSSGAKHRDLPQGALATFVHHLQQFVRSLLCPNKSQSTHSKVPTTKTFDHTDNDLVAVITRRALVLVSIAVVLFASLRGDYSEYNIFPEWQWDHNVYIPRDTPSGSTGSNQTAERISLLAQVVTGKPLRNLADVSARPNRAYARQWKMDYANYYSGRASYGSRSCFDKVVVLNSILENQQREAKEPPPLWPHPPRVEYDSIILLQPDSIITDLDKNLVDLLLPRDKLVAIAGWSDGKKVNSYSDVILFNLKHQHADAVAKRWWELVLPVQETCGANNDLEMLIAAIGWVKDDEEDLDKLIEPLVETSDGFVGNHLMKCIAPSVPGSREALLTNNFQESLGILQETADAVCYRFYPKCEVL